MNRTDFTLIEGGDPSQRQAAEWFSRLRADDVREADRDAHRQWMDSDPEHRAAYQRVEDLWSMLGDFAHAPGLDRLMHPPLETSDRRPAQRHRRPRWMPAVAAAAVVALAVIAGMPLGVQQRLQPAEATPFATGDSERRSIDLEDGSRMDLDAGTRVEVRYTREARRIALLSGRAYFKVAKDARRPFEVVSEQGLVRALGTQFETSLQAGALDVALFEGSVALLTQQQRDKPPAATLTPGQQARIQSNRVTVLPTRVAYRPSIALPRDAKDSLVFNDTPVSEAIAAFNRRSTQKIRLEVDDLGEQRITGVFHDHDPDGFIEALGELYGLREELSADGTRILRPNLQ